MKLTEQQLEAIEEFYRKRDSKHGIGMSLSEYLEKEFVEEKTASIRIDSIKDSSGWYELGNDLGFSEEKIYKIFEYGEYADITVVVDQNLNIVGGKIHPFIKSEIQVNEQK